MVTRNVVLTERQDQLVQALVSSDRYQNAGEALRAGLRLLEHEEAGVMKIGATLREGLAQAQAGDLAKGSGADAVRRAFARARSEAGADRFALHGVLKKAWSTSPDGQ